MADEVDEKLVKKRMGEATHLLAKAASIIEQAEEGLEWVWLVHSDWENYFITDRINQAVKAIGYALANLVIWDDEPDNQTTKQED